MVSPTIEERLSKLEMKVALLLNEKHDEQLVMPWWEQWFGAFENNPDFDAAMERGAKYRRSQPTCSEDFKSDDDVSS